MNGQIRVGFVSVGTAFLLIALNGCAPKSFSPAAPDWKAVELHDSLKGNYDAAWQKTVDTVARNWDIEILDKDSGYLRTAWLHGIAGEPYKSYRGRLTLKYPYVRKPTMFEVRTDAQWLKSGSNGWVSGFDSIFQREVHAALSDRLGQSAPAE